MPVVGAVCLGMSNRGLLSEGVHPRASNSIALEEGPLECSSV